MSPGAGRALLLDYGGVLTTPIQVALAAFFVETGVGPERFRDVVAEAYERGAATGDALSGWQASGAVAALETGRMPLVDFEDWLAAELSEGLATPLAPEGLAARLFGALQPDREMFGAVRAARRQGVATAVVSNTWGVPPIIADREDLFDAVVLSHEVGCRKPEPAIYRLAAARLGVAPEACVFVDDLPVNVEGAEAVGMAGVLHRAASITLARLEDRLGVSLGRP